VRDRILERSFYPCFADGEDHVLDRGRQRGE
jgi:hypothetical protein